jgi:ceramide glucosyltransferase
MGCVAAWKYARARRLSRPHENKAAISVLKPLSGADFELEVNLRSFFEQDHGEYEILFAVREESDAAVPIVRRLQAEFPGVSSRLLLVGQPEFQNAKVWSLDHLTRAARHDLLVMADSDIRVDRGFLRRVAAEFADPGLDLATCPYRAVSGPSFWSWTEAIGLNTEFISGLLVARMLEGVKFTVGPTVISRRRVIEAVGGWKAFRNYLAEDFVLGQRAAERGFGVELSGLVVEHHIGSEAAGKNFAHRLRWNRSTRRSRPGGYVGQVFMNPGPWALVLMAIYPSWWPMALACLMLRWIAAEVMNRGVLENRRWLSPFGLIVQDILSLIFWVMGFFGSTIAWRNREYVLHADGTFTLKGSGAR